MATKKQRRNRLVGVIAGIILLLVFLNSQGIIDLKLQSFSTFSSSSIDIDGQQNILVFGRVGLGSDELVMQFTQEDLNRELAGEGYAVDRGATLRIDLESSEETWTLQRNGNEKFWQLGLQDTGDYFGFFNTRSALISECEDRLRVPIATGFLKDEFIDNLWCVKIDEFGTNGNARGGQRDDYAIRFSSEGDSKVMTPNNQRITLLNGNIEATFEGGVSGGSSLEQIPYNIYYDRNNNPNRLISTASSVWAGSNAETSKSASDVRTLVNNIQTLDYEGNVNAVQRVNSDLTRALTDQGNSFLNNPVVEEFRFESGNLVVDVNEITNLQDIKIILKASYLGVRRLSGNPQITECVPDIEEFTSPNIEERMSVKNIGNEDGSFLFSADCSNSDIDVFGLGGTVRKGDTESFPVTISGIASPGEKLTGRCTLTIEDRNSGAKDTCDFNVEITGTDTLCIPNQNFCDGDILKRCDSEGVSGATVQDCSSSDLVCGLDESRDFACVEEGGIFGGGGIFEGGGNGIGEFFDNLFGTNDNSCSSCQDWVYDAFGIKQCDESFLGKITFGIAGFGVVDEIGCGAFSLGLGAIIVITLILVFVIKDMTMKNKTLKRNKWMGWIISIILALVIGSLLFLLLNLIADNIWLLIGIFVLIFVIIFIFNRVVGRRRR